MLFVLAVGLGVSEVTGATQVTKYVVTVLHLRTPYGTLVVEVEDPGIKVKIDEDGQEITITGHAAAEFETDGFKSFLALAVTAFLSQGKSGKAKLRKASEM